jgi:hypothetical protein
VKAAEWKRSADVVAAVLPEYSAIRFGFVKSTEWIASGYYADSSAFSSSAFYLNAFVMPRFIPAESIYFDYGFRVDGQWEKIGPELADAVAAAEPKLADAATLDGLLAAASDWQRNINHAELRLCVSVLMRDEAAFAEAKHATTDLVPEVRWEAEVRTRCLEFAALAADQGFQAGEAVLASRRPEADRVLV